MRILGIETSCDETALSIVGADGAIDNPSFNLVDSVLFSQIDIHKAFGGVFPAIAKREHAKRLVPLLKELLQKTKTEHGGYTEINTQEVSSLLEREYDLHKDFIEYISNIKKPNIDAIAVTYGPGLEPALWVGINFAKALGKVWGIPVIATNHMEGHVISPLLSETKTPVVFPALALLISGGHTELVLVQSWGQYKMIGVTRDDAVGEAFDKVARLIGLPYPGGPEISKLAEIARLKKYPRVYKLPRPMLKSQDYDFSFSGIKTAVLYTLKDKPAITDELKADLAREFEDAVTEVLLTKTKKALEEYYAQSLIIGGGVIANNYITQAFTILSNKMHLHLHIPTKNLSTDNATMIAMAGYITWLKNDKTINNNDIRASGNASMV